MTRERPAPDDKKPEPHTSDDVRLLPMQLQVGDRLVEPTGEWEIVTLPYTTGNSVQVRVQRVGAPGTDGIRSWSAHERIAVRRASAQRGG